MATVLRHLPGQHGVHRLPVERLAELRDRRARETVRYAAEHVPYYRDLFAERGVDPRTLRDAASLAQLPLIDRRVIQAAPERFRATSRAGREASAFSTSGSTGTPVTVYRDRTALLANIAHSEREREVEVLYGGRRYGYPVVQVMNPGGNEQRVRQYYSKTSFRPLRPRVHEVYVRDRVENVVGEINRLRPLVLRSYGTYAELLFRTVVARGLELHAPKVVVYGGDPISPEGRKLVEEAFGSPVLSRYGAAEAFKIGFFCEERDAFHLHEELTHVRIVDAAGNELPDGELGEVVVSDLINRGGAVLNYRLGDLARMLGRGCACGRTTRRLTDLEGRRNSVLVLHDGELLHSVIVDRTIRRDGVLRFQLEQLSERRFVVRLLLLDPDAFDRIASELVSDLKALLHGAEVEAEHRPELESAPGPKFRTVVPLRGAEALVP
jgi:phenylacetate-CoA ligase